MLPKGVRVSSTPTGIAISTKTITTTGTLNTEPLPMNTMKAGNPAMTPPWVRPMAIPLTIVMEPRVARMGETPR